MEVLKEFYNYLKHPYINVREDVTIDKAISDCFILFCFIFSFVILVIAPLMSLVGVDEMEHAMEMIEKQFSPFKLILFTVVIGPVVEELIFRLPLKYRKLVYMYDFLLINFISFYIANQFGPTAIMISLVCSLITSISWIYWRSRNLDLNNIDQFNRNFPIYFYGMAVCFAFIHILNFSLEPSMWWATPILVSPQFILGLLLGYVRLKYGIMYSIFVHALNNFIPVMALVFFKDLIGMG